MEDMGHAAVQTSKTTWRTVMTSKTGGAQTKGPCPPPVAGHEGDGEAAVSIALVEAPLNVSEVSHRCLYVSDVNSSDINSPDVNICPTFEDDFGPGPRTSMKFPLCDTCSNPAAVTQNMEEFLAHFSAHHCHLCRRKKSFDLHQSLLLHVQKMHLQKAVRVGGYVLVRCHLLCGQRSAHYHCPYCAYTSCGMTDIKRHVLAHEKHRKSFVSSSEKACTIPEIPVKSEHELDKEGTTEILGGSLNGERLNYQCVEALHRSGKNDLISCSSSSLLQSSPDLKKPSVLNLCKNRSVYNEGALRERNCSSILETHLTSDELIKEIKEEPPPPHASEDIVNTVEPKAPIDCISVKLEEEEEAASNVCLNVCASEQTPRNWRLSLPASVQDAFDELTLDTCYLCTHSIKFESKTLLEVHFFRHHVRHSIAYTGDCVGLVCNLGCCGLGRHSHCPRCSFLAEDLLEVRSHYSEYHSRDEKDGCTKETLCRGNKTRLLADISGLESPPLLLELLMLEVDAVPSLITASLCDKARQSVVLDAVALHEKIKYPHCLLCSDGREYLNPRLFIHFQRCHVKRANVSCVLPSLMCRLSCKSFTRGHYHCPLCTFVIHDLTKLKVHQQKIHRDALQCAQTELAAGRTITPEALTVDVLDGASQTHTKLCRRGIIRGKNRSQREQEVEEEGCTALPVSVVEDMTAAWSRLKLPDCYLCRSQRDFITKKRLLEHFERSHVKRAIDYPPYNILSCHLYNDKYRDRGHYHCPWCWYSTHDRPIIYAHLENHSRKMELANRRLVVLPSRRSNHVYVDDDGALNEILMSRPLPLHDKAQVRAWQRRFHVYLQHCESRHGLQGVGRGSTSLNSSRISEASNRNFKVIGVPRLGVRKSLVKHKSSPQSAASSVVPTRLPRSSDAACVPASHIASRSYTSKARAANTNPRGCRDVAGVEEFFRILYSLHVTPSGAHVPARQVMRQLQRKYTHIPRSVARKFLDFCPKCGSAARLLSLGKAKRPLLGKLSSRKVLAGLKEAGTAAGAAEVDAPIRRVTVEMFDRPPRDQKELVMDDCSQPGDDCDELMQTARCTTGRTSRSLSGSHQAADAGISCSTLLPAGRFMALMLVNVIDMRDYPDDGHQYIVHCQDAHSHLHFLLALRQLRTREIAHVIISKVVSVTGLPLHIVSSSGAEFVESLVTQIDLMWTGSCSSLLTNCKSLSASTTREQDVSDSSDVVRELTMRILAAVSAGRPVLWTSWLPHVQYTLNTQTKLPQLTPFQVVFRRSVGPPVVKSETSSPLNLELASPGIISHQCFLSPRVEGQKSDGTNIKSMDNTDMEILDVTAGGFHVDDGALSHVEVVLPKNSNSNTHDADTDFSISSADLLGEGGENAVIVMHPLSHFSVGATGDVLTSGIPEDLSPNVNNLDTIKEIVPVDDAFTVENAIAVEAVADRDTVAVRDTMTVDDFMAVENTVTVESVTGGLSDSTSIFSSSRNTHGEIFPTLESVVEDPENYFC
ncbi:Zinc finger C2H2-type [Trinorchestia longiramus]|nr:Zinc finger C2H2-type [Trinorchestia longiramus]